MLKIGILGGADIAFRMFVPSLLETEEGKCVKVASHSEERRNKFEKEFSVDTVGSYDEILHDETIEAVYIPLPPSLHFEWGRKALLMGKHVLLEKPSTTEYTETRHLLRLAEEKGLAIQENYMFQYHEQLQRIKELIQEGAVGDVRLIRTSFGFPLREKGDFRYKKELGGGALLDAGGYVTKLASLFLGDTVEVKAASLHGMPGYEVDMFGSATFENEKQEVVQGGFGLDCHYQCSLEVWGNRGKLFTNRIFTAPKGYKPTALLETSEGQRTIELPQDGHFKNSIQRFIEATQNAALRKKMADDMECQSRLIDEIRRKANAEV